MPLLTARRLPSEGEPRMDMEEASGRVAPMVVEPPPSRATASTQPSSMSRWATWVRVAPML